MTNPPIEFIDCDLTQMRRVYQENAIHIIPYCGYDLRPRIHLGQHQGYSVISIQQIHYYDGDGEPVCDIVRIFCSGVEPVDYPLYFRCHSQVHRLTKW